ncbi:rhodanese-like domain-containing protein [Spirillospora sp. CA-294931]|uniref:rhodanese-like domain-containing protein n=1 Tax=Spirillospora sp. CA-294931 TaxID=3240042 RepID=UPI003D91DB15
MPATIGRVDLRTAIEAGTVTVVDALGGTYYEQRHLPGAVSLVEDQVAERAATVLPDKNATIVTYCSNTACGNSKAVALRLEKLGYTDVRTYPEGIEDWTNAGLPVESVTDPARA